MVKCIYLNGIFGTILGHFGGDSGPFWSIFGSTEVILRRLSGHVGIVLASFRCRFGIVLAQFEAFLGPFLDHLCPFLAKFTVMLIMSPMLPICGSQQAIQAGTQKKQLWRKFL